MRRVLCLLYLIFVSSSILLGQTILDKKISLEANNITLEDILYSLRKDHDINLSFSNNILPNKKVSLYLKKQPVRKVLDNILSTTLIKYKIIGEQIVLFKVKAPLKKYILEGYIKDKASGEYLIGANVLVNDRYGGTFTNTDGFFSLKLTEGKHTITFSYSGYQPYSTTVNIDKNKKLDVDIESLTLEEIVVIDSKNQNKYLQQDKSITNISNKELSLSTNVGGEGDVLKTINNLPGVSSGADGIGGINVRGGSIDQNLYLLDGVAIYNPTHMLGTFSIFNGESIESASFYKGHFPARYGGRLSSVLDVQTKNGDMQRYSGGLSLGISSAKLSIEGPIVKGKSSFFIAARTTPISLLIRPVSKEIKARNGKNGEINLNFYDLNAKFNYHFSEKDQLVLSFYKGDDHLKNRIFSALRMIGDSIQINNRLHEKLHWGNTAISLNWNHKFKRDLSLDVILSYSDYHFESDFTGFVSSSKGDTTVSVIEQKRYLSKNKNYNLKTDFHYVINDNQELNFGSEFISHRFQPGSYESISKVDLVIDEDEAEEFINFNLTRAVSKANEYSFYTQYNLLLDKLQLKAGLRWSGIDVTDKFYHKLQPRISLAYSPTNHLKFMGSFSQSQQFIHLLTASGVGLPTDIWVPSTKRIKPENSTTYALGIYFAKSKHFNLSIEGYYKKMNNLIDYSDNASLSFVDTENYENNTVSGIGFSKGVELSSYLKFRNIGTSLSYTLSKSTRQFDKLNNGKVFPFRYDRRHNLNLNLYYQITRKWDISANFVYGSGLAVSLPSSSYTNYTSGGFRESINVLVYEERNGFRLPPNHRLDLLASWTNKRNIFTHKISFGIYNVYNRKNVLYYRIGKSADNNNKTTFVSASLIPILPYFVYSIKF